MSATLTLFHLVGSVCLLLWGLRMVQTGISRGFGVELRKVIQKYAGNRISAFCSGLITTILVQSSTTTALITASFARTGFLSLATGIAIILGADVGTALVAQILSLNVSFLPYFLITIGLVLHKTTHTVHKQQIGRIIIGLSLMLFALMFIRESAEPLKQSEILTRIFVSLESEPFIAILVAAALAWIAHSSLAAVLLIASLVSAQTIPLELGIILLLGANVGGTIPAIINTLGSGIAARQITIGNSLIKVVGVVCVLPFLEFLTQFVSDYGTGQSRILIDFHLLFNAGLAVLMIPFVTPVSRLLETLVQDPTNGRGSITTKYLDESVIDTPALALNYASREVLGMSEYVEEMLRGAREVLADGDLEKIEHLTELDDLIDDLYEEIKLYVTKVSSQEMDSKESMRATEILLFTTNLEHIGDIVENILTMSRKRVMENLSFSDEGLAEIENLHSGVCDNLHLATSVFMSGDVSIARKLLKQKTEISKLQNTLTQNHLERLRTGKPESISTSALHLDILRDLRRIQSHISAVAYPVLEAAGALRKTRLKK